MLNHLSPGARLTPAPRAALHLPANRQNGLCVGAERYCQFDRMALCRSTTARCVCAGQPAPGRQRECVSRVMNEGVRRPRGRAALQGSPARQGSPASGQIFFFSEKKTQTPARRIPCPAIRAAIGLNEEEKEEEGASSSGVCVCVFECVFVSVCVFVFRFSSHLVTLSVKSKFLR